MSDIFSEYDASCRTKIQSRDRIFKGSTLTLKGIQHNKHSSLQSIHLLFLFFLFLFKVFHLFFFSCLFCLFCFFFHFSCFLFFFFKLLKLFSFLSFDFIFFLTLFHNLRRSFVIWQNFSWKREFAFNSVVRHLYLILKFKL